MGLPFPAGGISVGWGFSDAQYIVDFTRAITGGFGSDRIGLTRLYVLRTWTAAVANERLA